LKPLIYLENLPSYNHKIINKITNGKTSPNHKPLKLFQKPLTTTTNEKNKMKTLLVASKTSNN
jgi:hypothetical protein